MEACQFLSEGKGVIAPRFNWGAIRVRSLSHSKWKSKYHIVVALKYRRRIIYRQLRADLGRILRELRERKGAETIEAESCPNHIHMLVVIPPHLKYRRGNRHFWCRGYYADTVGKCENAIKDYIKNQLQEDITNDQISMKELIDPFIGE